MANHDREIPPAADPGHDAAVARSKRRWLVAGLLVAAIGTALNKALGFALSGRMLVAAGAVLALIALLRPFTAVAIDRALTRLGRRLGMVPDPGEEDTR